jgi:hypothetical protein
VGGDDPADAMRSGGDEWAVKFPEEIEGVCEAKRWNAEMLKADASARMGGGVLLWFGRLGSRCAVDSHTNDSETDQPRNVSNES